jgi:hypothetical protein
MRAAVAGIQETGALSAAVVARLTVARDGTMDPLAVLFSRMATRFSHAPVERRAAACPEGDAAGDCESLISKWH